MLITSWDIGIKNLSFCTLEYIDNTTPKIKDWGIISLCDPSEKCKKVSLDKLILKIFEKLDSMFVCNDMRILIENQPCMKNPTMKSIQTVMYTYFCYQKHTLFPGLEVSLVSASNKLKIGAHVEYPETITKIKSLYSQKKKKGIFLCDLFLKESIHDTGNWYDFFTGSRKKDDLADSFLYCMWYISNH